MGLLEKYLGYRWATQGRGGGGGGGGGLAILMLLFLGLLAIMLVLRAIGNFFANLYATFYAPQTGVATVVVSVILALIFSFFGSCSYEQAQRILNNESGVFSFPGFAIFSLTLAPFFIAYYIYRGQPEQITQGGFLLFITPFAYAYGTYKYLQYLHRAHRLLTRSYGYLPGFVVFISAFYVLIGGYFEIQGVYLGPDFAYRVPTYLFIIGAVMGALVLRSKDEITTKTEKDRRKEKENTKKNDQQTEASNTQGEKPQGGTTAGDDERKPHPSYPDDFSKQKAARVVARLTHEFDADQETVVADLKMYLSQSVSLSEAEEQLRQKYQEIDSNQQ